MLWNLTAPTMTVLMPSRKSLKSRRRFKYSHLVRQKRLRMTKMKIA
jgi:hypothetical protein